LVGQCPDGSVAHGTTPVKHGVFENELENMRGGEIGDENVARSEILAYNDVDTSN
jgi:hypothetical protein